MIKSERVTEIFLNCLFQEEEIIDGKPVVEPIYVEGIFVTFALHPKRVYESKTEVDSLIGELHETFKEGWTFMKLCETKDGELWTGSHRVCEQLMVLGIAVKKMEYCCPKTMWYMLPHNMPYVRVI